MKKSLLLSLLLTGCYIQPPTEKKDELDMNAPNKIYAYKKDGHSYLIFGRGGIVHNEGCTNETHKYIKLQ